MERGLDSDLVLIRAHLRVLNNSWDSLMRAMDENNGKLSDGESTQWEVLFGSGAILWDITSFEVPSAPRRLASAVRAGDLARAVAEGRSSAAVLAELGSLLRHPENPRLAQLLGKKAAGKLKALESIELKAHRLHPDDPDAAARYLERQTKQA